MFLDQGGERFGTPDGEAGANPLAHEEIEAFSGGVDRLFRVGVAVRVRHLDSGHEVRDDIFRTENIGSCDDPAMPL